MASDVFWIITALDEQSHYVCRLCETDLLVDVMICLSVMVDRFIVRGHLMSVDCVGQIHCWMPWFAVDCGRQIHCLMSWSACQSW